MVWKYTWNDLLSDTEFRKYMTGNSGLIDILCVSSTKFDITLPKKLHKKGTIYLYEKKPNNEGEKIEEAHFISYEIQGKNFIIHDPADLNVQFSGWFSKHALGALRKRLPGYTVDVSDIHPQKCLWDTFCQTWSLAQLMGIPLHDVNKMTSRRVLYDIVQKIARSPKFTRYINHNSDIIQGWMGVHLKGYPRSKLRTPIDFITFSKTLAYKNFQMFI